MVVNLSASFLLQTIIIATTFENLYPNPYCNTVQKAPCTHQVDVRKSQLGTQFTTYNYYSANLLPIIAAVPMFEGLYQVIILLVCPAIASRKLTLHVVN